MTQTSWPGGGGMNRMEHRMDRGTPEPWNKGHGLRETDHGIYFRSTIRFLYQFPTGIVTGQNMYFQILIYTEIFATQILKSG